MGGFTKLVPELVQSSIWNESPEVRCVWIAILATKDEHGYIRGNVAYIARLSNVSLDSAKEALEKFQSPDVDSNSTEDEGRRIQSVPGGWFVINHEKYRAREYREVESERKRKFRENNKKTPQPAGCGFVYYAGINGGDRVKIGFSRNPWCRIAELKCAMPKIELLAIEPGDMGLEDKRHTEFSAYHVEREWFSSGEKLLAHISSVRDSSTTIPDSSASASTSAFVLEGGCKGEVESKRLPLPKKEVEIPERLLSMSGFSEAFASWLEFRKAKKAPVNDRVKATIFKRLMERPYEAVAAIDTCMVAGWIDIKWDWIDNRNGKKPKVNRSEDNIL